MFTSGTGSTLGWLTTRIGGLVLTFGKTELEMSKFTIYILRGNFEVPPIRCPLQAWFHPEAGVWDCHCHWSHLKCDQSHSQSQGQWWLMQGWWWWLCRTPGCFPQRRESGSGRRIPHCLLPWHTYWARSLLTWQWDWIWVLTVSIKRRSKPGNSAELVSPAFFIASVCWMTSSVMPVQLIWTEWEGHHRSNGYDIEYAVIGIKFVCSHL